MSCFSLAWLEQVLVWLIIVGAIIAIVRLVIPWVLAQVGIPMLGQVLNIIFGAIICIIVIWIIFASLSCLSGMGGVGLFPHH